MRCPLLATVKQHAHRVAAEVRNHEVDCAIPVQVAGDHEDGTKARRWSRTRILECSRPVPAKYTHDVTALACDGEVGFPIPVEIADGKERRATEHRPRGQSLKRAVSVAQQHTDRRATEVRYGQVEETIAVEVTNGY